MSKAFVGLYLIEALRNPALLIAAEALNRRTVRVRAGKKCGLLTIVNSDLGRWDRFLRRGLLGPPLADEFFALRCIVFEGIVGMLLFIS